MNTILDVLRTQHGACDTLFAATEVPVGQKRRGIAHSLFQRFRDPMRLQATMEEQIRFPAIEAGKSQCVDPTWTIRLEHHRMLELMLRMATVIAEGNASEYLGLSDTLNMLRPEHNRKEESMVALLSDHALAATQDKLIRKMGSIAK
jgi:Hemerythrin HHE cation binding domain